MVLHIGESILEFLYREGKAYLPELGTFSLHNEPNQFTLDNHILTPPTQKLVLTSDVGTKAFSKYIADKYKIKTSTADLVLSKFAKKVNNCLLNFGSCGVDNLGLIKKTKDGDMELEPTIGNYHPSYLFLEPITLKPLGEGSLHTQDNAAKNQIEESTTIHDTVVDKVATPLEEVVPAVVASSGVAAAASSQSLDTTKTPDTTAPKKSFSQSLNEAYKDQLGKNQSGDTTSSTVSEAPYAPVYQEKKSLFSRLLWPLLLLAFILLSVFGCMRYCGDGTSSLGSMLGADKNGMGIDDSEDSKNNVSLSTDGSSSGSVVDSALLSQPNYLKYKDVLTAENLSTGCIIIVGSFKKSTNATKMKDQIIRAGLEPYSEFYGEFTRVGTLFECLDHDLEGYIDSLRSSFDSKSWYLEPDLEVPYK